MGSIHDRFKEKESRQGQNFAGVIPPRETVSTRTDPHDVEERSAFSKQKYIIAVHPVLKEVALVFPNFLVHADMARSVFRGMGIVAAGFFEIYPGGSVRVNGRSGFAR